MSDSSKKLILIKKYYDAGDFVSLRKEIKELLSDNSASDDEKNEAVKILNSVKTDKVAMIGFIFTGLVLLYLLVKFLF
jgi:hypothetical protein